MDLHQLKTFVAVAREGSITRASERLHLSQPAVSAHIKAMEDALGLALFERTARGMALTSDGLRLLAKAEQTLDAHRALMAEATRRTDGRLTGRLRLGAAANAETDAIGALLAALAEEHPDVEVALRHGTSAEIVAALRDGSLDAAFYHEAGKPEPELTTVEVASFATFVVAPPGLVTPTDPLDWPALAELAWIYPTSSACCGRTAESLFRAHRIRPKRIVNVDREDVTRTLVGRRIGIGLLHEATAEEARARGEVEVLHQAPTRIRVLHAHRTDRAADPLVAAASALVRARR